MASRPRKKRSPAEPPRHLTPPADAITPPSIHRQSLLPLVDVGSRKFEELCRDLLRKAHPELSRASLKRTSGVAQFGVDVEGFDDKGRPSVVLSAKCYREIQAWHFKPWIEDFSKHLDGHWKGKGVTRFILAVSHECNVDEMNDAARILTDELDSVGISFELWHTHSISELLVETPHLVDRYFHRSWSEALSASVVLPAAGIGSPNPVFKGGGRVGLTQIAEELQAVVGQMSDAWSASLDSALRELRRGRSSEIVGWLQRARGDGALWNDIAADVRAKALRASAMVALRDGDREKCARLLDDADVLSPPPDRTARTILIRNREGLGAALSYLERPSGTREHEVRAALLVEDDAPEQALNLLETFVGDAVTPEILRLRAICEFQRGKRKVGTNLAASAVAKSPDLAGPLFSLGTIRVASALVEGVSVQFGGPPVPLSRSLVRSDSESLEQLCQAVQVFERLLETVDGNFRRDVEVWKLAALVLHPGMRRQARLYARTLLSREDPDPAAIAWCLHHTLPIRKGHVRKKLSDSLRRGTGTPSHVTLLAFLVAKPTDPSPALALLARYGSEFPEAKDFFAEWKEQFIEEGTSEQGKFRSAVQAVIMGEDPAQLVEHLKGDISIEALMFCAELLMSRRRFAEVDSLRSRILSIGNFRALEIAGRAAASVGKHRDVLHMLEAARTAGHELSPNLIYLRVEANEVLGEHRELIGDLRHFLRQQEDPQLHDRLIGAYLRIGALEEVRAETELALSSGTLGENRAVQVAYALRQTDPEVARRALEQTRHDNLPTAMTGVLASLASELGMEALKDTMVRRMVQAEGQTPGVKAIGSVEELIEMLRRNAEGYKRLFDEWLAGSIPAAVAMRSDRKAYASLFLAEPAFRRNSLGDLFPMLLSTSGSSNQAVVLPRPHLRIDLGAALLACRLDLIAALDEAFEVVVPPSLPEALLELAAEFRATSSDLATAIELIVSGRSAIEVVKDIGTQANDVEGLHETTLAGLLGQAFRSGHITRADATRTAARLALDADWQSASPPDEPLELSAESVATLASTGILESLARSFHFRVSETTLETLVGGLERTRSDAAIGAMIADLRKLVAGKLATSAWKSSSARAEDEDERAKTLPPHVRCLIESMPDEEHGGSGKLAWIEDRMISRHRLAQVLNVTDVIRRLSGSGLLTSTARAAALAKLRDAGYSFIAPETADIVRLLDDAPVINGTLIENPPLASLRRSFAINVENLAYIDRHTAVDGQGAIQGEMRRMLELGALLRNVLTVIWSGDNASVIEKRARSSWAWSSLHLEHLPEPLGSELPDARRQFAAVTMAHLMSTPFLAELDRVSMPAEWRKPYMDWVTDTMAPVCDADRNLRHDIGDVITVMLCRFLEEEPDLDPELRIALHGETTRLAWAFLELLPDDWRDIIAGDDRLVPRLGSKAVITADFAGIGKVRMVDLEAAISKVVTQSGQSGQVELQSHGRDKTFTLETLPHDGKRQPMNLVSGSRQCPIEPATLALVHPDPGARAAILAEINRADGQPGFEPSLVTTIIGETDVDSRIKAFQQAQQRDYRHLMSRLQARLNAGEALRLADIALPEPCTLSTYIGLPRQFIGDGNDLIGSSSERLLRAVGPDETGRRLAGMPLRLPEVLFEAARTLSVGATNTGDLFFRYRHALARARHALPDDASALDDLFKNLERLTAFFAPLVRHGMRKACSSAEWLALPLETMVSLVWLHAANVSTMLATALRDADDFATWLSSSFPVSFQALDRLETLPSWASRFAARLDPSNLLAAMIAEAIREGMAPTPFMKTLAGTEVDGVWVPDPRSMAAALEGEREFWVEVDPIPQFISAGWLPPDGSVSARSDQAVAESLLTGLVDPDATAPAVLMMVDVRKLDHATLARMKAFMEAQIAADQGELYDKTTRPAMHALALVMAAQQDSVAFMTFLATQARSAARAWKNFRRAWTSDEVPYALFLSLAECALSFARRSGSTFEDRMKLWAEAIERIVEQWPECGRSAMESLEAVVQRTDVATSANSIRPTLLKLRATV